MSWRDFYRTVTNPYAAPGRFYSGAGHHGVDFAAAPHQSIPTYVKAKCVLNGHSSVLGNYTVLKAGLIYYGWAHLLIGTRPDLGQTLVPGDSVGKASTWGDDHGSAWRSPPLSRRRRRHEHLPHHRDPGLEGPGAEVPRRGPRWRHRLRHRLAAGEHRRRHRPRLRRSDRDLRGGSRGVSGAGDEAGHQHSGLTPPGGRVASLWISEATRNLRCAPRPVEPPPRRLGSTHQLRDRGDVGARLHDLDPQHVPGGGQSRSRAHLVGLDGGRLPDRVRRHTDSSGHLRGAGGYLPDPGWGAAVPGRADRVRGYSPVRRAGRTPDFHLVAHDDAVAAVVLPRVVPAARARARQGRNPLMQYAFVTGVATTYAAQVGPAFDINQVLGLLGVGAGSAVGWKLITLLVDKIVPSRSDKRSDVETSLGALAKTIEILSMEKASDAAAVARANARIRELEDDGAKDYDLIRVLKDAKDDLERRIVAKDVHITQLAAELAKYGAKVTFDGEGHLRIDAVRAQTGPIPTVRAQ
ncbi:hypothetical protein Q3G72_027507 [Acer saccharum]|nr:hypothetical protein Q3G72_009480 [Acer saccharum]KAK1548463.1 hypothetical protein Q3G72_027507 [Acer saccharum]